MRQQGGPPRKALPGEELLVVRKSNLLNQKKKSTVSLPDVLLRVAQPIGPQRSNPNEWAGYSNTDEHCTTDDFEARSPDELSLLKGERIELIERDDDFGDGWYLGKHLQNGKTGLFPEGEQTPGNKECEKS